MKIYTEYGTPYAKQRESQKIVKSYPSSAILNTNLQQEGSKTMEKSIADILVERDGLTRQEAEEEVARAKVDLRNMIEAGETPWDFCEDRFGLEPDYLDELMY
jgi:hypothetical protein